MTALDAWMPAYDVAARYAVHVPAPPSRVYAALLATDIARPWLVRALMGVRLAATWRRRGRPSPRRRSTLRDLEHFVLLEERPPHEIVLGITGRFWKLEAEMVPVPPERFRDALPAGLAQAAWNFAVSEAPGGSTLSTETRIRCADAAARRRFRLYWRLVAPGSGLIRGAILRQVRREAVVPAP